MFPEHAEHQQKSRRYPDASGLSARRGDFLLDEDGRPQFIAGVPPDYFNAEGHRWGNMIYNWDKMEKDGFSFWLSRLSCSAGLYDIIRIDHFRAFDTYWKIPASCETARVGQWVCAPGKALFKKIYETMPDIEIFAEDLGGDLTPGVAELRDGFGLMGMNVADFTILSDEKPIEHQLIYTGTHDNQTVRGWYAGMDAKERKRFRAVYRACGRDRHGRRLFRWRQPHPRLRHELRASLKSRRTNRGDCGILKVQ